MFKKITACAVSLAMAACLLTFPVGAADYYEYLPTDTNKVSVWDGSVDEDWGTTYDDSNKKLFIINTAAEFVKFRNMVWEGKHSFGGETVSLAAHIDLNNLNWAYGIGGKNKSFNGVFDGNGYTIRNLKLNPNEADEADVQSTEPTYPRYTGLFGSLTNWTGNILSTHLQNASITLYNDVMGASANGQDVMAVGALLGMLEGSDSQCRLMGCSAKNVTFYGTETNNNVNAEVFVAGLVGAVRGGTLASDYVDGVDFSGISQNVWDATTYCSGVANLGVGASASAVYARNCYAANLKYNLDDIQNFDSVGLIRSSGNALLNVNLYDYNGVIGVDDQKYYFATDKYDHKRAAEVTRDQDTTNVVAVPGDGETIADKLFYTQKGDNTYIMFVDLKDFGRNPVVGAERTLALQTELQSGGQPIADLSSANGEALSVHFKMYNATGDATTNRIDSPDVTFDFVLACYNKAGELITVQKKQFTTVGQSNDYNTLAYFTDGECRTAHWQYGPSINRSNWRIVGIKEGEGPNTSISFDSVNLEDIDQMKVFVWQTMNDMTALADVTTVGR